MLKDVDHLIQVNAYDLAHLICNIMSVKKFGNTKNVYRYIEDYDMPEEMKTVCQFVLADYDK